MMRIDVNNRGIYLVIYNGPGQEDKKNDKGLLWLPPGACKFGKSLNIKKVKKRYLDHCNGNVEVTIVGRFKDQDDLHAIEKLLHGRFKENRLKNRNNRSSEWMDPINESQLKKIFKEVINEHFELWD